MNRCKICLSNKVSPVVEKNRVLFYCNNCGTKDTKIIQSDREIYSRVINGNLTHVTIAALVKKGNKYLVLDRKHFPHGQSIVTGHMELDETVRESLFREVKEEVDLDLRQCNLLLNCTVPDECKNGAHYHEWYLFECKANGKVKVNQESSNYHWMDKEELEKANLTFVTRQILNRAGIIDDASNDRAGQLQKTGNTVKFNFSDKSVIESLPYPVIIYNDRSVFKNKSASLFLKNINSSYKVEKAIQMLARTCVNHKAEYSKTLELPEGVVLNLTAIPIIGKKSVSATITIVDITKEVETASYNEIAYDSLLNVCSNEDFSIIYKALLKQLMDILDIRGCSLMVLKDGYLKVAFRYTTLKHSRPKPLTLKIGEGVAGWVAKNRMLLAVPDTSGDKMFVGRPTSCEKSLLSIPVISDNQVLGVLNLSKPRGKYFSEKETKTASIIASRIALAMENEQLYQELKTDRKKTASIIDNSADGIAAENANGEIIIWNKRIAEITGFKSAKKYLEANTGHAQRIQSMVKRARATGKDTIYEEQTRINAKGEIIPLGVTYSIVWDKDNNVDFMIVQMKDLFREKTIERQQKEFIYTTTHELRTPITAIKGYLSMILNGDAGKVNPKQTKYFNRVFGATEKLVSLVEDLLSVARVEEGDIKFDIAPFDLQLLVKEVVKDFRPKAEAKKVGIRLAFNNKSLEVLGDKERTKQAISNLVDNAIKYTAKGNVKITLGKHGKGCAKVEISDTGVGIPNKELENIFDRFYRVPNSESVKAGGTGLGLYIVKKLIEKEKGKIEVNSKLGEGTTFSITLPLSKKENI